MKKDIEKIKHHVSEIRNIIYESEFMADLTEMLGSSLKQFENEVNDLDKINDNTNQIFNTLEETIHPKKEIEKKTKFKNTDIG